MLYVDFFVYVSYITGKKNANCSDRYPIKFPKALLKMITCSFYVFILTQSLLFILIKLFTICCEHA